MKYFCLCIFSFILSIHASAAMTEQEQVDYLENTAKEIRRSYWVASYVDVTSTILQFGKDDIDDYVKTSNNERYEDPLEGTQISQLYKCHYRQTCELYVVYISLSMHGGSGVMSHFILLNTDEKSHTEVKHMNYAE